MALGSYPSHRYIKSWIAQRLFNNVPEWAEVRTNPISLGQQILNPISLDIQDTYQQLARLRYDQFLSTADLQQLDSVSRLDLLPEMEFQYTTDSSGIKKYTPPTVYGTISSTEYEITQAENNDINTLIYDNLPSRIEDGETTYSYQPIINTTIASLASVSPASITINGHLYVTIKNNTNWEQRTDRNIYYPKVYITGTTRKGTSVTEAIPIRYNGTFKTINEWQEVSSVFASYFDSAATIIIETFPNNRLSYLDTQNIHVPSIGGERMQFTKLGTASFGSTFIAESFTVANMDIVRSGVEERDTIYEIELLNSSQANVSLVDYIHRPNTRFIYAIDDSNFYVYDVSLPYPEVSNLIGESEDSKIDLAFDRWIYKRGDIAKIATHNIDESEVPWRVRWRVLDPNENEYFMGLDGSLWPTTIDGWIDNDQWPNKLWEEQVIEFTVSLSGSYIITLEAEYYNDITNTTKVLYSKILFFLPAIEPEVQFSLPVGLQDSTTINLDSDNKIWLQRYDGMHLLNIYFDYFLVDYENSRVYTKEDYSNIRIVI